MATISYLTDRPKTRVFNIRSVAPVASSAVVSFAVAVCAASNKKYAGQANKKGQLLLTIGPSGKLVAGTGFEPVTFGL